MRPGSHQSLTMLTIDDFIALANLADPNLNLPPLSTFYQPGSSVAEGTAALQAFMEELKGTPFHDHVWDASPEQIARNYETVRSIRETLRELARAIAKPPGERPSVVPSHCPMPLARFRFSTTSSAYLETVSAETPVWRKFLEELELVDLRRLKICAECGRLFWTQRQDQRTCPQSLKQAARPPERSRAARASSRPPASSPTTS